MIEQDIITGYVVGKTIIMPSPRRMVDTNGGH